MTPPLSHSRHRCSVWLCLALLSFASLLHVSASSAACAVYVPAVEQNCYLHLDPPLPFAESANSNPANDYTSRYDCALALGYYLPCVLSTANRSYQAIYHSLASTPCLIGSQPVAVVNHSTLTVVEVDSQGAVGLLSSYKHDNSTLSGNVGSCAGSVNSNAAAGVSHTGGTCCSLDQSLQPIASAALITLQSGYGKSTYTLTPHNTPVLANSYQLQQQAVAAEMCPAANLPPFPVQVRCTSATSLLTLAGSVVQLCYFNPLYPLNPVSSATLSLTRATCALSYAEFALCQLALNNASSHALATAASKSSLARNVTVTAAAGAGLISCCATPGVPTIAVLLQIAYNTITGLGG